MSAASPKTWLLATRPWSFPASATPGLIALSFAAVQAAHGSGPRISWALGLAAVLGAVLFQAAGNVISDYYDYRRGVDREGAFGGSRLLVDRVLTPRAELTFGLVLLGVGVALGLVLTALSGPWLLAIGALGVAAALFYSHCKFVALGDAMIFATFGLLIPLGVAYCATGRLDWAVLLPSATAGLLIVAILHANNTRDIATDREAGIRTQAMLLGLKPSILYYLALVFGAYVLLALLVGLGRAFPLGLVALLSLPLAVRNARAMRRARPGDVSAIAGVDVATAQLVLVFSVLLVAGNLITLVLR